MCAQRSAPSEAVVMHATVYPSSPTGVLCLLWFVWTACVRMDVRARAAAYSRLDESGSLQRESSKSTKDVQFPFQGTFELQHMACRASVPIAFDAVLLLVCRHLSIVAC